MEQRTLCPICNLRLGAAGLPGSTCPECAQAITATYLQAQFDQLKAAGYSDADASIALMEALHHVGIMGGEDDGECDDQDDSA